MLLYFYSGFVTGILFGGIFGFALFKNKTNGERKKNPTKSNENPVITLDGEDLEKADKLADEWEKELSAIMNYGGLAPQKYAVGITKPPYLKGQEDGE